MNSLAPALPHTNSASETDSEVFEIPAARTSRVGAYLQLAKPRIGLMVLLATSVGYVLGTQEGWHTLPLVHACLGILLAVIASSAFNQLIERETDAKMPRTKNRPLPSSRLSATEVLIFALFCAIFSVTYLYFVVNPTTAWLTLATIALYSVCYTPLKRYTSLCTVVGAVPGALPPVLGWAAAGAPLDAGAFSLFAIMFVWQFPHFLAIAWLYRDQYEQAGLRMLPASGRPGITGAISSAYAVVLLPISLLPAHWGLCGDAYGVIAISLGLVYLWVAILFQRNESRRYARRLIWTSLVYLPVVMLSLIIDHVRLMH